ncbi:GGDEF domain-containing protein [Undibacterium sp. Jales W-56]|uniref:GGDEF domain-containing protein n=1 Tax=Undibacterium sp. Jales W-56 TaxID=2897325 RepID=UPI0021CEFDA3|nr:GGDEF domain-containing protein [Undibacterium sp. Jales W-56]MCU6434245.1 GGDEF domain-containing protein [Undibacterium sp. Jales W-56]
MSSDKTPLNRKAELQLSQAIHQLKTGAEKAEVLPLLETVMAHLERMTRHDPLTGALNRNALIDSLNTELNRSHRTGHTFSVAIIRVDRFQDMMDQYGRAAVVQILRKLTEETQQLLRTLDSFGRNNADEFVIVMPTTWIDQSIKAIDRLKQTYAAIDWTGVADGVQISFCTGLTTNARGDTAEAMLERARQALAAAQAKGPDSVSQIEADLPGF